MKCRSCRADIMWARTEKGKAMPLDAVPTVKGNVTLIPQPAPGSTVARVLGGDELERYRADGETLWMPHWATCPTVNRHRR